MEDKGQQKNRRAKLFVSIFVQSHYTPFSCLVANIHSLWIDFSERVIFYRISDLLAILICLKLELLEKVF